MKVAVVLGMHKSGTSLISEILHRSGIDMVEQEPNLGYDEGFHFERRVTGEINKDLLGARDKHSLDTTTPVDAASTDPEIRREAAGFIADMSERGTDWGFKDPRTCLTYDFWRSVLPAHKLICIFRDVAEVHRHYARVKKGSASRVLNAWFRYNEGMLKAFEGTPESDRLALHYGSFMENDEGLTALSRFLGRPLADCRSDRLMRSKGAPQPTFRMKSAFHRLATAQDVNALNFRLREIALQSSSRWRDPA